MIKIPEIQYITRQDEKLTHAEQAKLMFKNGIKWVQLRMKDAPQDVVLSQAEEALHYAKKYDGLLIINDSIEIAQKIKAHGVHLGLKDKPADEAREQLGGNFIIGGTANTLQDIKMQVASGVDYVGLGPFRYTSTKKNLSPILGLKGYKEICNKLVELAITTPIIAVGGILKSDIPDILATGIKGVAISGSLLKEKKKIG